MTQKSDCIGSIEYRSYLVSAKNQIDNVDWSLQEALIEISANTIAKWFYIIWADRSKCARLIYLEILSEAYSGLCQTSKMELFGK